MWNHETLVFLWLIPLSIMSSRFIHLVTLQHVLPFKAWIIVCCVYVPCFLYPFIFSGSLGCFSILPVVNIGVMNMEVLVTLQDEILISVLLRKYPDVRLLDRITALFLIFWGTSILFSIAAVLVCNLINSVEGFQVHIFPNACLFIFDNNHSNGYEVIAHCLYSSFSCWLLMLSIF